MKQYFSLLCLLLTILSTVAQEGEVIIEGQIIGYKNSKPVKYTISPHFGFGNNASVHPDSLGRFRIAHSLDDTEYFFMYFSEGQTVHTCKLILQPGKHYSFISEGQDKSSDRYWETHYSPEIFQIDNRNDFNKLRSVIDKGNILFNLIDNGTRGMLYHDLWDLSKPDSLIPMLLDQNSKQLQDFQQLLDEGAIDQGFYEVAKMNLEYTNAYRLAQTIQDSWSGGRYKIKDSVLLNRLIKIYPSIFELFPVENVELKDHFCFDRYVDLYMTYLDDCYSGSFVPNSRRDNVTDQHKLSTEDILTEETHRVYKMITTSNYALNKGLGSSSLLRKHLNENPDLVSDDFAFFLYNVIIPEAESYEILFDSLSKENLPGEAIILDSEISINTLDQLLHLTGNKPMYIDFWGSWCSPCLYQLRFKKSLEAFLSDNNINMVYAAKEYAKTKTKWENCIKQYNLKGYHFILNDNFLKDLQSKGVDITGFPTYIIIGGDGTIFEPNAHSPSNSRELIQQLKKKLKL